MWRAARGRPLLLLGLAGATVVFFIARLPEVLGRTDAVDRLLEHPLADDVFVALFSFTVFALIASIVESRRALTQEQARRRAEERLLREQVSNLREQERLRLLFFGTMAHEIANPLTPMKLQLATLRQRFAPDDKGMHVLDRSVDRLTNLVTDVLDVARMQNGRLQVRPLPGDLAKAVSDAAAGYEAVAAAKGVALKVDAPPAPLAFDAQRITQVMANLLSNAIKFTPAGGTVSVQVDVGSAEVVVSVRDSGQGLDAADQARLFQPFGRADSQPQGKLTGTGLGLYLSKGIVEQHGGRIWCSSPGLGKGSTFAFALPTRVPQPPGAGFA